jgi:hypothetical protein
MTAPPGLAAVPVTARRAPLDVQGEIVALERRRRELLEQLAAIGPFRSGSVTALIRPCGKPGCRCSEPGDPGHGPNLRLTYKVDGKTHSESLPTPAAVRRARREIAAFRRFQQWKREFVEVNASICRLLASAREPGRASR